MDGTSGTPPTNRAPKVAADAFDVAPASTIDTQTRLQSPGPAASGSRYKRSRNTVEESTEPLDEVLLRRLTVIKEGDNVLLRLPSEGVKAVVASRDGLVQLGKFGAFPAHLLLGLHYDITYEITPSTDDTSALRPETPAASGSGVHDQAFGQMKGKKRKKDKGASREMGEVMRSNPGWRNTLRPLKRQPLVDAVVDDITETNEFIEDTDAARAALLSHEEISELRAQGLSATELIKRQIERHDGFGLKTDFSKEKWRKRKEKKFYQTVHPLAPSTQNIVNHYALRSPHSILHLREDTLSQLLVLSNIRPSGRYLLVDDTGGLLTAAVMERMGCEGRILTFTDSDSPPAWGVLSVMNFGEREMECVKWLSWMEADETYERPPPPPEDDMPAIAAQKTVARLRKYNGQVADLNATRDELHTANWDGLILATELSPLSILARLTPYLAGSATITVYSPYLQILAELLQFAKHDMNYLGSTLSESWSRTYQVLPGRTHPLMTTSATGGYLFHTTRVFPSKFEPTSHQRARRRKKVATTRNEGDERDGEDAEKLNNEGDLESSELGEDELPDEL